MRIAQVRGEAPLRGLALARWEPVPGTVLRGGVGLYQQPPNPAQSNAATGTPTLLPQRSAQASLGVAQVIVPGLTVDVTPFYKWLDRQVISNPASTYDPSAQRYTNEGTGRVYGGYSASMGSQWGSPPPPPPPAPGPAGPTMAS